MKLETPQKSSSRDIKVAQKAIVSMKFEELLNKAKKDEEAKSVIDQIKDVSDKINKIGKV